MKKEKGKKKDFWHPQMFTVDLDLFDCDIGVCVNSSEEDIKNWLKKISGEKYKDFPEDELKDWDTSKTDTGRMIQFLGGAVIILKLEKNKFRKACSIVCHEVCHLVFHLCNNRRTPLMADTDEVYAYMIEAMMLKILNNLY